MAQCKSKPSVFLHLKDYGLSFEDSTVHVSAREDRWFKRGPLCQTQEPLLTEKGGYNYHLTTKTLIVPHPNSVNLHSPIESPVAVANC